MLLLSGGVPVRVDTPNIAAFTWYFYVVLMASDTLLPEMTFLQIAIPLDLTVSFLDFECFCCFGRYCCSVLNLRRIVNPRSIWEHNGRWQHYKWLLNTKTASKMAILQMQISRNLAVAWRGFEWFCGIGGCCRCVVSLKRIANPVLEISEYTYYQQYC